jgi:prepilin-type processing-associated H-X9-DG protein
MGTEVGAKRFGPVLFGTDPEPQEDYIESGANPEVYTYSPAEARHYNRANAVFVDGHAESRTLRDLGYQMNDARLFSDVPTETAIPIPHPDKGPYEADNRFFNGEGVDRIAAEHHVAPGGG